MTELIRWPGTLPDVISKLLITGGSGFIGTNAVSFALQTGITVLNIDIVAPKDPLHADVWKQCDILDSAGLRRVVVDFDPTHVLHLAARTDLYERKDLKAYAANRTGVTNLIRALNGTNCRRAIFTSSMLVCRNGYVPRDDVDYCPDTLYGRSKMEGEYIVRHADLDYVWSIVRPTSIWGPWFEAPYRQFFRSVARGVYVHPGSAQVEKALGFVGNTVWQLYQTLTAPPDGVHTRTFYLTDYERITIHKWACLIAARCGTAPIKKAPLPLMRLAGITGDCLQALGVSTPPLTTFRLKNMLTPSGFDCTAIESITGPLPFSVEQGVEQTVTWLTDSGIL